MNKVVTIFGSSQPVAGDEEYETAYELGRLLSENNLDVCTGGYGGIMDAVSKGASEKGRRAIGVTVDIFGAIPNRYLTEEIMCHTLLERIDKLVSLGDAYVVLRGGTGTLVELSIVWELLNKKLIDKKPFAAHGEMWIDLINVIEKRIKFEKRETNLIKHFNEITDCASYIIGELR